MVDSLMMRAGVMFLIVGMLWGLEMGIRQDFSMAPAHAHFNLIGGVLLFVFGLYYRMVPNARDSGLAKWQGLLHFLGAILFPVGVAVVIKKGETFIALPIIGSLIVLVAVALFALIVFRTSRA
jgi:VIT1/CCC1 family predicted Fe2+/Mn2+ transporter